MEAMFLDFMMKVMRDTVPKSEMSLDSPATQIYTSMMDSETAQKAARAGGVGLADQIIAYWEADKYNLKKGQQGRPGGFHEDRANTQQSGARRTSGGNE
jgi:Rod binding domain-containing protein